MHHPSWPPRLVSKGESDCSDKAMRSIWRLLHRCPHDKRIGWRVGMKMSHVNRLGIALLVASATYLALAVLPRFSKTLHPDSAAYLEWARQSIAKSDNKHSGPIGLGFGYSAGCDTFLLEHLVATCVSLRIDEGGTPDEFRGALLSRVVLNCDSGDSHQDPTASRLCSGSVWPPYIRLSVTFFRAARGVHADGSITTTRTPTFHTRFWIARTRR